MLQVDDSKLLREQIRILKDKVAQQEEHIRQLNEALRPPAWEPPIELKLTKSEAIIIACLYKAKTDVVDKSRLYYALYHNDEEQPEIKIVDVFVCKMRKKLKQYGIEINTAWGRGYCLDLPSVAIMKNWGIDPNEPLVN